ncbi:MAG: efflux RND transporter periplasmic adaptor subunit [Terrimicrobiaceae bacterium]
MKLLRPILILTVLAALGFAGYTFLWSGDGKSKSDIDAELVASAERRDIEHTLLLTGEVVPAFKFEVKSEVGGKVKKLHALTGEYLTTGAPIATIDDTDLLTEKAAAETEIKGAQLAVDKNRGNYERAKALFEEKLISKEIFDNLQADLAISENTLEKSRSRLQSVEDRLRKTRIDAPAEGTVLDVLVNEGQVVVAAASVNAGTVLVNFADLSRLLIDSHVNQVDAPMLKKGQEIAVNAVGAQDGSIKARVEFIAPVATVKNNIKGFQVQAVIENNDGRLKPGMSVSMTAMVQKAPGAVAVPVSAIFKEQKQSVVYVRKGGHTEKRMVEVGITDLGFAEIRAGLEEGEEILLVEPEPADKKS